MGAMPFLVKNCWTLSTVWAGVLVNHPSWNGQTHWKNLPKKFSEAEPAFHNHASWCADTDGFQKHSPSGGNLYYKWLTQQHNSGVFWVTLVKPHHGRRPFLSPKMESQSREKSVQTSSPLPSSFLSHRHLPETFVLSNFPKLLFLSNSVYERSTPAGSLALHFLIFILT